MQKFNKYIIILTLCCFYNISKAQSCDTTMFDESLANGWSSVTYYAPSAFGPTYPAGYVAGSNGQDYVRKANYFDLSSTSYTYVKGAIIKFLKANCKTTANLSKPVFFKVYDDASGAPGNLLGTAQKTMAEIKTDVDAGANTIINFSSAIALPSSKKFYVSVGVDSLVWFTGGANNDSLCIAATADDQVLPETAWEWNSSDSTWTKISEDYNNPNQNNNDLNISLWIFPYVSTTAEGCGLLPVDLISFTAVRTNNDVNLKWEVSNEINMKGYSIEKADNNGVYKSIAFVNATNNLKNQQYTITDRNAFITSSTVQYRIKQVNADGSAVFSRIVSLNHNLSLTDVVFQNPVSSTLKIQMTFASSQKVLLQLYDMQGRVVTSVAPQTYTAGVNTVVVNTANYKPGTYILKVDTGQEQNVYKIVKQ